MFEADGEQLALLGRVALAMLLGGVIGFEREIAGKPAGIRTHMLVAGMATVLVGLGQALIGLYDLDAPASALRADPIRIVEAIITGISFLGAGSIIRREGSEIEGLTTAASILFTATVGIAMAVGQIVLAVGLVILGFVVLRPVDRLERWIERRRANRRRSHAS
ncbi:MAG: MgtC/SapB family protein [Gemmatimonadota bacterium]|nr:MgtC/SapB family protein [Gemmatimonadota bacterium]